MAEPLHVRISAELRDRILRGDLAPGSPLPSEAQLTEEFGTSRGTIRSALATLRSAGLIRGGQGKPPVVRAKTLSQPFENLLSFTSWAEKAGRVPGQRTVELARRPASAAIASHLEIDEGAPVVELLRVRLLDGEPVMLERSSWVLEVGRMLFENGFDPDAGSIYRSPAGRGGRPRDRPAHHGRRRGRRARRRAPRHPGGDAAPAGVPPRPGQRRHPAGVRRRPLHPRPGDLHLRQRPALRSRPQPPPAHPQGDAHDQPRRSPCVLARGPRHGGHDRRGGGTGLPGRSSAPSRRPSAAPSLPRWSSAGRGPRRRRRSPAS